MALHQDLSLWQKVLLGILCFPFLPIYLCVYCLCLKEDDKENDLEKGHQDTSAHTGKAQTQQKLSSNKLSIRNKGHTGDAQIKPKRNSIKLSFRNKGNQEAANIVPKDKDIKFPVINKGFQNDEESNNVKNGQYDNNNHLQEKKKRKDIHARTFKYPWDKSSLKSLPLDLKSFEKLDSYSSKVIGKGSIETLVKELLRDVSTDLEKTRAIWIWICHHIEYDIVGYKNEHLRSSDPKDVFKTRKGVCAGYSSLFEHMCSIAGVQCKTVSGYGKGMSYQVGQKITEDSNHAWNMVYLEGGWHLLDCTWGTGNCNNNMFSFKYNEFYFLTHPALFIEDHLPENSDCQLLERRISQKHFEQIVYRTPYFYNLGLLFSEPDTVIIETVKGMASIVIESSSRVLYLFDLNETEKTGFVRLMECKAKFFIYPEKTGKHKLNIYAKSHDSEGDYHSVLSYVVDCKSIETSMKIPKCLRIPAGPSWLSEKAGLFQPSHPDPIIYTKDGSFTICTNGLLNQNTRRRTNWSSVCMQYGALTKVLLLKGTLESQPFSCVSNESRLFNVAKMYRKKMRRRGVAGWSQARKTSRLQIKGSLPIYLCVYYLCLKKRAEESGLEEGFQSTSLQKNEDKINVNNVAIRKDKSNSPKTSTKQYDTPAQNIDNRVLQERTKQEDKRPTTFKYPWDGVNLKSLKLDLRNFQTLDSYGTKVFAVGTLEALIKDLLRDTSSDLEKTRIIWIWICYHIEYDTAAFRNKALHSSDAEHIFRTKKGVSAGYSSLFQHMCSIAGVQCKSVSGYGKGTGYKAGQKISGEIEHTWNMVYLEGGWHLVDTTWGAGHTDEHMSKFTFQYNEFYFLTHPALFIESHFPEKEDLQLLELPLSLTQFEQSVHRRSHFYNLGFKSSQPDTAVIETVNGLVSITIESKNRMQFLFHLNETEEPGLMKFNGNNATFEVYPQKMGQHTLQIFSKTLDSKEAYHLIVDYSVYCNYVPASMKIPKCLSNPAGPSWVSENAGLLQPSHPEPIIYTDDGCCTVRFSLNGIFKLITCLKSDEIKNLPNHIIQKVQDLKLELRIRLPKSGFYVLQIFVEPVGFICNYLLICSSLNVNWPPFPALLQNPVGPNPETEKAGLHNPSHTDPIIHTENGSCTVSFELNRMQTLTFSLKSDNAHTVLNHVIQKTQKNKVEFNVHLPHSGSYVLRIFNDSTGYICNYLLTCSNAKVKWPPYPALLHNPVGPSPESENFGLLQPSHPDPVINMEDGCCTVSFILNKMVTLIASLKCEEIPTLSNHILQTVQKDRVEFLIRLPRAGSYVLQIFEGSSRYIMNYLLTCTNTSVSCPSYPSMLQNPVGPNPETEKVGLLQPSHPDPIINTQDGCCTVTFAVKRELIFFSTLHCDDPQLASEMKYRYAFHARKEDKVEFKVRLPQSGTYVLRINIKTKNSNAYTSHCNYLIICSNPSVHWPVFPLVYDDWAQHYQLVEPLDGVLPKNSTVSFKLQVPDVTGLSVKGKSYWPLTLSEQGYWEGSCSTEDCKELFVTASCKQEPDTWVYLLQYQIQ
ncbi:Hypothetical predicted protein [Pelobates cultripes]|uniref:Transglutaminase-like domain-containing protein n=1 Tax=Pelobates cultripes TaxID=61616 RepID=A0AAD1VQP0_PELCU|nr:Hypothetical predicted protein [Pelobates cultripes]